MRIIVVLQCHNPGLPIGVVLALMLHCCAPRRRFCSTGQAASDNVPALIASACRCKKALTADGRITVDVVILPDGEEFKTMEVLQQARMLPRFLAMLFCCVLLRPQFFRVALLRCYAEAPMLLWWSTLLIAVR